MGLEAVVSDIQEKGRREATAIREETQKEVNEILRAAQQRVEVLKLAAEKEVQDRIERTTGQEDSAANLIVKRHLLNAQKEMLDQVYQTALKGFTELPASFHKEVLSRLLAQAVKEIGTGTVSCNPRDSSFIEEILTQDNTFAGLKLGRTVAIEGGIIVENNDRTLKLDLTYRSFLDKVWEGSLKDASDILFG